ncbi:MAG: hypothetical protein FDW93_06615 [Bergeyella sp.]|nr:hypothetical protein [Bergeyella sp.]
MTKKEEALSQMQEYRTRLFIYGLDPCMKELILHILKFNNNNVEEGGFLSGIPGALLGDYTILESDILAPAVSFRPNIVFVGSAVLPETYSPLIESIVPGGVFIFHSSLRVIKSGPLVTENYFRKIPYEVPLVKRIKNSLYLQTDYGEIPTSATDISKIRDLEGVRIFMQQLGIMEDTFYEAFACFSLN